MLLGRRLGRACPAGDDPGDVRPMTDLVKRAAAREVAKCNDAIAEVRMMVGTGVDDPGATPSPSTPPLHTDCTSRRGTLSFRRA
jgi:hypothetical protein